MTPETRDLIARRAATIDRVRRILVEELALEIEPEEVDLDAPLFITGLGLDSVDGIELAFAIEAAFGVTLPPDEEAALVTRSVNRIVDFVLAAKEYPSGACIERGP